MNTRFSEIESLLNKLQNYDGKLTTNCDDLIEILKCRLGESNKNMVSLTLKVLYQIFIRHSKPIKYLGLLFQHIIYCFGDTKPSVRQDAYGALTSLINPSSFEIVKSENFAFALKTENKQQILLVIDPYRNFFESSMEGILIWFVYWILG